ncbi:MAG: hypothetical protein K2M62_04635 [Muribaculaceae bacterium]|nr:hypothetical protein [Muribaculaceae bacterium]
MENIENINLNSDAENRKSAKEISQQLFNAGKESVAAHLIEAVERSGGIVSLSAMQEVESKDWAVWEFLKDNRYCSVQMLPQDYSYTDGFIVVRIRIDFSNIRILEDEVYKLKETVNDINIFASGAMVYEMSPVEDEEWELPGDWVDLKIDVKIDLSIPYFQTDLQPMFEKVWQTIPQLEKQYMKGLEKYGLKRGKRDEE